MLYFYTKYIFTLNTTMLPSYFIRFRQILNGKFKGKVYNFVVDINEKKIYFSTDRNIAKFIELFFYLYLCYTSTTDYFIFAVHRQNKKILKNNFHRRDITASKEIIDNISSLEIFVQNIRSKFKLNLKKNFWLC